MAGTPQGLDESGQLAGAVVGGNDTPALARVMGGGRHFRSLDRARRARRGRKYFLQSNPRYLSPPGEVVLSSVRSATVGCSPHDPSATLGILPGPGITHASPEAGATCARGGVLSEDHRPALRGLRSRTVRSCPSHTRRGSPR